MLRYIERYHDKADYIAQIARAANALEQSGYILVEDRQRIIDRAAAQPLLAWVSLSDDLGTVTQPRWRQNLRGERTLALH